MECSWKNCVSLHINSNQSSEPRWVTEEYRRSLSEDIHLSCKMPSRYAELSSMEIRWLKRWKVYHANPAAVWSHGMLHILNIAHGLEIGLEGNANRFLPITSRLSKGLKTEIEAVESSVGESTYYENMRLRVQILLHTRKAWCHPVHLYSCCWM